MARARNEIVVKRPRCKVALYSHDTMGLGHARRNMLVAQSLVSSSLNPSILLIVGSPEAANCTLPGGAECVALPAYRKTIDGRYEARPPGPTLSELVALRSRRILAAVKSFGPDVLIVDKEPRGALGELNATLEWLSGNGRTPCVLGLRDVLDEPEVVKAQWREADNETAIRRFYDAVWVYGDSAVYDPAQEYGFSPDVAAKIHYVGYLDQRMRLQFHSRDVDEYIAAVQGQIALCLVGGGQDGVMLADAFSQAEFGGDTTGVIITGPFMPTDAQHGLKARAEARNDLKVFDFVSEPALLIERAKSVVGMGGYNTICEGLSFEKRALIVPRIKPRSEQLIRAVRFRDLGLLDMLHPADLSPEALTKWLALDGSPSTSARKLVHLNGATSLPILFRKVAAHSDGKGGAGHAT